MKRKGGLSPINLLMLTVLIDMTGFGMIIPLIPFYAQRFASGAAGIGILIASYSVMQLLFSPVLGRVSDTRGRRPVLIFSILTSVGSFALFTFASNYFALLVSRLVAGLATEGAVAQAYVADITTKEERSSGIGKIGAATGIGFILGPVFGGLLSPYGLRAPGYAALFLSLVNLVLLFVLLPEPERHSVGSSESGLMESLRGVLEAVREPFIGQVYIIFFFVTLAFAAIPVIVPLLAIEYYGFTEVEMSYVFIFIGLIQVFLQGFAIKKLVSRLGEEKLIIFGPLLLLLGVVLTPILRSIPGFGLSTVLVSLGVGITNTVVPGFISLMTSDDMQGSKLGVAQSVASIARIFGPLIGGFATDLGGVQIPFYVSGALLLAPFFLGCRLFQACTLNGLLGPLDRRKREDIHFQD
ncbi:MAG: MFS transporter [Candidatus Wukongarchaeota archaeon]|nr:MFS transporter [Candidatus Wukongarchaeota archaeon]